MTDEALISEIQKGNVDCFSQLVDRYQSRVYNITYRFTNGHPDCQDLAQEIFLLVYRNLPSFRNQSSLSTWIYRIAVNRCLDWCKKAKRNRKYLFEPASESWEGDDVLDRIPNSTDTPEESYIKKERDRSLHEAIAQLPEKYKAVIIMYHFQKLSYKEIGEILDLSSRTIETQLYRGKQKLKELLLKQEGGQHIWNAKEYSLI